MLPQRAVKSQEEKVSIAKGIDLALIEIPGGPFNIGENDKQHSGTLATFCLGKYPVTNAQYNAFVAATGTNAPEWKEEGNDYNIFTGSDTYYKSLGAALMEADHPVVGVSWDNAVAFCNWLSEETGQQYGLPSETQWEYAARGGQESEGFPYAGSHRLKEVAWYTENSHRATKPVGLKLPNELGLYDMSGNVWEWCADHWHNSYKGAPDDRGARLGNKDAGRVVRGGSWDNYVNFCQVSYRYVRVNNYRSGYNGFRLARYQSPQR